MKASKKGYEEQKIVGMVGICGDLAAAPGRRWGRPSVCPVLVGEAMAAYGPAWSQLSGTRPVRIITSAAGSNGEFTARIVAQGLPERPSKQYIVENRAIAGVEPVARAAPDG